MTMNDNIYNYIYIYISTLHQLLQEFVVEQEQEQEQEQQQQQQLQLGE